LNGVITVILRYSHDITENDSRVYFLANVNENIIVRPSAMAKSGRLELRDNILRTYSTTVT